MRISAVAALFILSLPLEGLASKPAVKAVNGRLFGGYSYSETDRETQSLSLNSETFEYLFAGSEVRSWHTGGSLSFPILHWLGGALALRGGESTFDEIGEPEFGLADSSVDTRGVRTGGSLFIRDPEIGYVGVGYDFDWSDAPSVDVRSDIHSASIAAGLYIPDLALGPVDWSLTFGYGRERLEVSVPGTPTSHDHANSFRATGSIGWYWGDTMQLEGGVRWRKRLPDLYETTSVLSGIVALSWLLPPGDRRHVTATIFGIIGSEATEVSSPFTDLDQQTFDVGFQLTFSYPGAGSLLELYREY